MSTRFRKLVDQHRNRVYTNAYYSLGTREEAEDVSQEVLLRLWKHYEELDEKLIPAWLSRVTRNACIDAIRRRRAYTARVVANGGPDGEEIFEGISTVPAADAAAEASQARDHIMQALSKLQEPHKSIVILREIQDMKYEQISETLDLPLNTVKSYLHRGRRMLREQLSEVLRNDS